MSYGDNTDVTALVPEIAGATLPTTSTIDGWCNQFSAVVDAKLKSKGYTVPVTGANDILSLTPFIVQRAAVNAARAMSLGNRYDTRIEQWLAEWEQLLKDIENDTFELEGQTPVIYQTTIFHRSFSPLYTRNNRHN